MIRVAESLADWRDLRRSFGSRTVGFVPTMGALHPGHRSLLERARRENEVVAASIFVNPTQFDDANDLARYPRTLEEDLRLMEGVTDAVLAPKASDLYPERYSYRVSETLLSRGLEGAHRPGHFDGMLTIVLKLLNVAAPTRAYFGEKDWQQLQLVKGMVSAFMIPVEIVACPTVREPDGLAMSSRNRRLPPGARARAPLFAKALRESASAKAAAESLEEAGFGVDYVEDVEESVPVNGRPAGRVRVGAVRLEGVRLIDNVRL